MSKRITIHDIAREAGVSAATVSYVINDTAGQSISQETKDKIWHVINMFNYKPNVFAKNLRSSARKIIAVCTQTENYADKADFIDVLEKLSLAFNGKYDLVFIAPPFGRITSADAIIAYNVSRETFYAIGNANYIPLIAVNCCVEDKLFFQITPDFEKLRAKADNYFKTDYAFVCPEPNDAELKNRILSAFETVRFTDDIFSVKDTAVFTINGFIADFFKRRNVDLYYEDIYLPLCRHTADCVEKALSREPFDVHIYTV